MQTKSVKSNSEHIRSAVNAVKTSVCAIQEAKTKIENRLSELRQKRLEIETALPSRGEVREFIKHQIRDLGSEALEKVWRSSWHAFTPTNMVPFNIIQSVDAAGVETRRVTQPQAANPLAAETNGLMGKVFEMEPVMPTVLFGLLGPALEKAIDDFFAGAEYLPFPEESIMPLAARPAEHERLNSEIMDLKQQLLEAENALETLMTRAPDSMGGQDGPKVLAGEEDRTAEILNKQLDEKRRAGELRIPIPGVLACPERANVATSTEGDGFGLMSA